MKVISFFPPFNRSLCHSLTMWVIWSRICQSAFIQHLYQIKYQSIINYCHCLHSHFESMHILFTLVRFNAFKKNRFSHKSASTTIFIAPSRPKPPALPRVFHHSSSAASQLCLPTHLPYQIRPNLLPSLSPLRIFIPFPSHLLSSANSLCFTPDFIIYFPLPVRKYISWTSWFHLNSKWSKKLTSTMQVMWWTGTTCSRHTN